MKRGLPLSVTIVALAFPTLASAAEPRLEVRKTGDSVRLVWSLPVSETPHFSDCRTSGVTCIDLPTSGGAEVFGYETTMAEKAAAVSTVRPAGIPAMFPPASALNAIAFDPTTIITGFLGCRPSQRPDAEPRSALPRRSRFLPRTRFHASIDE